MITIGLDHKEFALLAYLIDEEGIFICWEYVMRKKCMVLCHNIRAGTVHLLFSRRDYSKSLFCA